MVVIRGAAILDARLGALFLSRLIQGKTSQRLLNDGPLSAFAARARVAYSLGWIVDGTLSS
jgi:hypothetical protein